MTLYPIMQSTIEVHAVAETQPMLNDKLEGDRTILPVLLALYTQDGTRFALSLSIGTFMYYNNDDLSPEPDFSQLYNKRPQVYFRRFTFPITDSQCWSFTEAQLALQAFRQLEEMLKTEAAAFQTLPAALVLSEIRTRSAKLMSRVPADPAPATADKPTVCSENQTLLEDLMRYNTKQKTS